MSNEDYVAMVLAMDLYGDKPSRGQEAYEKSMSDIKKFFPGEIAAYSLGYADRHREQEMVDRGGKHVEALEAKAKAISSLSKVYLAKMENAKENAGG